MSEKTQWYFAIKALDPSRATIRLRQIGPFRTEEKALLFADRAARLLEKQGVNLDGPDKRTQRSIQIEVGSLEPANFWRDATHEIEHAIVNH